MDITVNIAVAIIAFVIFVIVFALALLIQYLVMRAAVRGGIDRSQLAAFIRQAKLAEVQEEYKEIEQNDKS